MIRSNKSCGKKTKRRERGQGKDCKSESALINNRHEYFFLILLLLETFIFSRPKTSHTASYCNVTSPTNSSSPAAHSSATSWKKEWGEQFQNLKASHLAAKNSETTGNKLRMEHAGLFCFLSLKLH